MKKLIQLCLILVAAAFGPRAHAATYTNFLDNASNAIAQVYPFTEGTAQARLGKALKAFNKDSTTVAGDYNIFFAISTQLLPLLGTPGTETISETLSNAFTSFVTEAATQAAVLDGRLGALSEFQKMRRPASNNLAQAQAALLVAMTTTNIQQGILSVRLAFVKLRVAEKLIAKGEAKPGFAPDSVTGDSLTHTEGGSTGTISFVDGTNYTDEGAGGTYTYTRTGLHTATLVLLETESGGTTTVLLKFSSDNEGRFSFRFESPENNDSGSGTFTFAD